LFDTESPAVRRRSTPRLVRISIQSSRVRRSVHRGSADATLADARFVASANSLNFTSWMNADRELMDEGRPFGRDPDVASAGFPGCQRGERRLQVERMPSERANRFMVPAGSTAENVPCRSDARRGPDGAIAPAGGADVGSAAARFNAAISSLPSTTRGSKRMAVRRKTPRRLWPEKAFISMV